MEQLMKTWHFTANSLPIEIDKWVKQQVATGHPVAIKKAQFVGQAIADFLCNAESLYTENDSNEIEKTVDTSDINDIEAMVEMFNNSFDQLK
jgi:hypothetical protein